MNKTLIIIFSPLKMLRNALFGRSIHFHRIDYTFCKILQNGVNHFPVQQSNRSQFRGCKLLIRVCIIKSICLPSFAIYAGASLFAITSFACCLIVSMSRLPARSLLLLRRVVHWTTATFFVYVINILLLQMETASKLGIIQSLK